MGSTLQPATSPHPQHRDSFPRSIPVLELREACEAWGQAVLSFVLKSSPVGLAFAYLTESTHIRGSESVADAFAFFRELSCVKRRPEVWEVQFPTTHGYLECSVTVTLLVVLCQKGGRKNWV